jgi:hypothetical protein
LIVFDALRVNLIFAQAGGINQYQYPSPQQIQIVSGIMDKISAIIKIGLKGTTISKKRRGKIRTQSVKTSRNSIVKPAKYQPKKALNECAFHGVVYAAHPVLKPSTIVIKSSNSPKASNRERTASPNIKKSGIIIRNILENASIAFGLSFLYTY